MADISLISNKDIYSSSTIPEISSLKKILQKKDLIVLKMPILEKDVLLNHPELKNILDSDFIHGEVSDNRCYFLKKKLFENTFNKDDQKVKQYISEKLEVREHSSFDFVPYFFGLSFGGIMLVLGLYLKDGHFSFSESLNFDKLSALGAIISALTSIIAFPTLFLLYKTYTSQKEELRATQKIAKEQSQTLQIQKFENTLFNLLDSYEKIKSSISYNTLYRDFYLGDNDEHYQLTPNVTLYGGQAIHIIYFTELKKRVNNQIVLLDEKAYSKIYNKYEVHFEPYFYTIFNILQHIHLSKDVSDKATYINFLTTRMSSHEKFIMFYHLMYYTKYEEVKKFTFLINEYQVLKQKNIDLVISKEDLKEFEKLEVIAF